MKQHNIDQVIRRLIYEERKDPETVISLLMEQGLTYEESKRMVQEAIQIEHQSDVQETASASGKRFVFVSKSPIARFIGLIVGLILIFSTFAFLGIIFLIVLVFIFFVAAIGYLKLRKNSKN